MKKVHEFVPHIDTKEEIKTPATLETQKKLVALATKQVKNGYKADPFQGQVGIMTTLFLPDGSGEPGGSLVVDVDQKYGEVRNVRYIVHKDDYNVFYNIEPYPDRSYMKKSWIQRQQMPLPLVMPSERMNVFEIAESALTTMAKIHKDMERNRQAAELGLDVVPEAEAQELLAYFGNLVPRSDDLKIMREKSIDADLVRKTNQN